MTRTGWSRRSVLASLAAPLIAGPVRAAGTGPGPLVLAAASLQPVLTAIDRDWVAAGHAPARLSYAASSALARQLGAGAVADLFITADDEWMDWAARAGRIRTNSRVLLAGNRLAIVAAADGPVRRIRDARRELLPALGQGRLAVGDPAHVPAGRYARAALERLGLWAQIEPRLAPAENVRAALALVERGAAPLGIVYLTDAVDSRSVRLVGTFPAGSHPPIRYPMALPVTATHPDDDRLRRFLLSGPAQRRLRAFGFTRPA